MIDIEDARICVRLSQSHPRHKTIYRLHKHPVRLPYRIEKFLFFNSLLDESNLVKSTVYIHCYK